MALLLDAVRCSARMGIEVWLARLRALVAESEGGLRSVEVASTAGTAAVILQLTFAAHDLRAEPYLAEGRVFLPEEGTADDGDYMWFNCGYELKGDGIRATPAGRLFVTIVQRLLAEDFLHGHLNSPWLPQAQANYADMAAWMLKRTSKAG